MTTPPDISAIDDDLSVRQTLLFIGLAGLTIVLIAFVPWFNALNYPFRLLLTTVHELGHGVAALLTGGQFLRFVIEPNGAGLAYTAGGWRFVIIPAGYLGVAIFGAGLILLGRNYRTSRLVMGGLGIAMILLTLRYGVPSIFSIQMTSGLLTTTSGLIFGGLFLWTAIKAPPGLLIYLVHVVAIQATFTAFSDLATVIGLSTRFFDTQANDAQSMALLTGLPAVVWAVTWAVIALILLVGAIWAAWIRPYR